MIESLLHFEQITERFAPVVLVVPGLAAVLLGLFVWLGGLGLRRLLIVLAGAGAGFACGLLVLDKSIIISALIAVLCAVLGVIFRRIIIMILAAAVAVVICFIILVQPYIKAPAQQISGLTEEKAQLTVDESIKTAEVYLVDFKTEVKRVQMAMPAYYRAILVASAAGGILAGYFIFDVTSALCCSCLGTMFIFTGMIMLLLFKGSGPISTLIDKKVFYGGVFGVMVLFGTAEQLLLCKLARKKGKKPSEEEPQRPLSWTSR